jgi:hypothetical protein
MAAAYFETNFCDKMSAFTDMRAEMDSLVSKKFDYAHARRLIEELRTSLDDIHHMLKNCMIDDDQAMILVQERDELHGLLTTIIEIS